MALAIKINSGGAENFCSSFPGEISSRGPGTDGARRQHDALVDEGVEVTQAAGGGSYKVKLSTYGWFPETVEPADTSEDTEDHA